MSVYISLWNTQEDNARSRSTAGFNLQEAAKGIILEGPGYLPRKSVTSLGILALLAMFLRLSRRFNLHFPNDCH